MNRNRFLKRLPLFWPGFPLFQQKQSTLQFQSLGLNGATRDSGINDGRSSWDQSHSYRDNSRSHSFFSLSSYFYLSSVAIAALILREDSQIHGFFGSNKPTSPNLLRNQMKGRVAAVQYSANNPIEDRYSCSQLKNIQGFAVTVFDGHGGTKVSEFAHKVLHEELDKALLEVSKTESMSTDDWICSSIKKAFESVEAALLKMQLEDLKENQNQRAGRVGSCCLLHLIANEKVYSANMGDCRSIVVKNEGTLPGFVKLNKKQNANSSREQADLRRRFPNDKNIVHCKKGNSNACYVKVNLSCFKFNCFR